MIHLWPRKTIRTYFIRTENRDKDEKVFIFFSFLIALNTVSCKGKAENIGRSGEYRRL